MRGWVKYLIFLLIIFAMVLWLGGFLSKKEKPAEVSRSAKVVSGLEIGQVEKVEVLESPYMGQVVADKRVELSTRLMGRIKGLYAREGQKVAPGQLLVSIDSQDLQAQVSAVDHQIKQAEQALASAVAHYEAMKKTFERYSALLKEGAVTLQEFDQIKAQHDAAKAQVEQARAGLRTVQSQKQVVASNLNYASLTSPVRGVVVQKNADVGDLAVPGHPLLIIEAPPYLFEVFLPEKMAGRIKTGEEYQVHLPALNMSTKAKVAEISQAIDPATRTFRVKLQLQEVDGIRSGMYGSLLLPEKVQALLVPESAIVRRFDFTGVWVVRPDNTLELRFVKLGERRGSKVEILSGLKEGERVVVRGVEKACEGCKVGG